MRSKKKIKRPEFDENSPAWLKRLMQMPEAKLSESEGILNLSIEGIIRLCLNKDFTQSVDINSNPIIPLTHVIITAQQHKGVVMSRLWPA